MINNYRRITENEIAFVVLKILSEKNNGKATITELKHQIPDYTNLSEADRELSMTRPNEEVWEQQVRNIISHRNSEGNIIAEGYATYDPEDHSLKITDRGRVYIKNHNL